MRHVAVVGAGELGAGWAALFAAYGWYVTIVDPDAGAAQRVEAALRELSSLGLGAVAEASMKVARDVEEVASDADWIQEAIPEALDLKQSLFARVEGLAKSDAIIASSTSSFTRAQLGEGMRDAARLVIVHPLHPVYAVPIVEVSVDDALPRETLELVVSTLRSMEREPVLVKGDIAGLVANRLTAALLREALDLIGRGAVRAAELDRIVSRGIGLGWTARGPLLTEVIGAGLDAPDQLPAALGSTLAPLWSSLARWDALDGDARTAVERELRNSLGGIHKTHAAGESTWVKTLSRVARAAGGD
ncbi:MAG: 3-hydroxyacyl-CoA dehydrogenase NAD-binding domain-containing protein [Gemmatimonadota bacterium]|nr:3-hydroxyacyl-CoA dehydrogenase NAD-binding domain-containing protein [Gemmatimonadota bacterium]